MGEASCGLLGRQAVSLGALGGGDWGVGEAAVTSLWGLANNEKPEKIPKGVRPHLAFVPASSWCSNPSHSSLGLWLAVTGWLLETWCGRSNIHPPCLQSKSPESLCRNVEVLINTISNMGLDYPQCLLSLGIGNIIRLFLGNLLSLSWETNSFTFFFFLMIGFCDPARCCFN